QSLDFIGKEGTVLQAAQNVMLAEVFQITFCFLAGSYVCEGKQYLIPLGFVAGCHPELQVGVNHTAVQCVGGQFTLLEQNAVPKVDDLFPELVAHVLAKDFVKVLQQGQLAGGLQQGEGVMVDVQNPFFIKAAFNEFGVDIGKGP